MHLKDVASRAATFATRFGATDEAYLAGLFHDFGKYGELFQRRLRGEVSGIDHWSAGAAEVLRACKGAGVASAAAIAGHHVGIPGLSRSFLQHLSRLYPAEADASDPQLSCSDPDLLRERAAKDGIRPVPSTQSLYDYHTHLEEGLCTAAGMLDVRMLYSTLVDADFLETEAHFLAGAGGEKRYQADPPPLSPERGLQAVLARISELRTNASSSPEVAAVRDRLLSACLDAAAAPPGLFTLTAPTGTGKTLAMLAFALQHAALHGLDRVVLVVPYLSILEQTTRAYRVALSSHFSAVDLQRYLLEDHSLVGILGESEGESPEDLDDEGSRLLASARPSWNAPMVLTTSVQMLESLFAYRPRACRKLHRLAKAVLLFDEVQTLPLRLAVPTLATLSHLCSKYRTSVVFSTATQPAFSDLDAHIRLFSASGWKPREIVSPDQVRLKSRVSVKWPTDEVLLSWNEVAERMLASSQIMCIVNLKRHAGALFGALRSSCSDGVFHLSTNMCPGHRLAVIGAVHEALAKKKSCRLVATQCVEAGVDLDFPEVMRAFGPLDAIIQAAGRCNRNGARKTGRVSVFVPEEERFPDGAYQRAADVTRLLLRAHGGSLDLDDLLQHREYYSRLYSIADPATLDEQLTRAIKDQDFEEVAKNYHLIQRAGVEVLVPWSEPKYSSLADEVRAVGLTAHWVRRARPHAVNLFRPGREDTHRYIMEPVRVGAEARADDWYIYLNPDHYDSELGLIIPEDSDLLIA